MVVKKVYRGVYERCQYKLTDIGAISFPKSGRTWIKSYLANYISEFYGTPIADNFCPILKNKITTNVPRVLFTHAKHRDEPQREIDHFIDRFCGKKIILLARNPADVVFSYYCRLLKRMKDNKVVVVSYDQFLKDPYLGVSRVVRFLNDWHGSQNKFSGFYISKYESCKKKPIDNFIKILNFFEIPVDRAIVELSYRKSVDTTRKIEEGGLEINQQVIDDIAKGDAYFESSDFGLSHFRYKGNSLLADELMSRGSKAYVEQEIKKLHADFGY